MSEQPSLFDARPPARPLPSTGRTRQSRATSQAAAARAAVRAPGQCDRLLAFYRHRGADGATDAEAALACGIKRWCVPARRIELVARGHAVVNTGQERDDCVVWRLQEAM